MTPANIVMGVDIGGTHITAALVDLKNKQVIPGSLKRSSVNAFDTADEIINAWSTCMRSAQQHNKVENICLAMPGPFDYESGISLMRGQAKYESLYGINIKERLSATLLVPAQSIFTDNDAACFLQGEVFNGAARMHSNETVIGITLGTGLGSAVYHQGKSRSADRWCWPFKDGISEEYLCTRWFTHRWKELTGETINGVNELAVAAETSTAARNIFSEFGEHLAYFLLDFIQGEAPSAVVIGGNISKAYKWFGPSLVPLIKDRQPHIKIEQAILGEEALLLGAVSSWLQQQKSLLRSR